MSRAVEFGSGRTASTPHVVDVELAAPGPGEVRVTVRAAGISGSGEPGRPGELYPVAFGARGGNGGVQDADNLAWKLAAVIQGRASPALVQTYDTERIPAADENIGHSTRATDFITPKTDAARAYRDAALALAEHHAFARPMVNSGRLSRPARVPVAGDTDEWPGCLPPGSPAADAPVGQGDWLLRHVGGDWTLLVFGPAVPPVSGVRTVRVAPDALHDVRGLAAERYGAAPGACVLLRPDQHVAALFRRFDAVRIGAAVAAALGRTALEVAA